MHLTRFHAPLRDGPDAGFKVELVPLGSEDLARARSRKDSEFERTRGNPKRFPDPGNQTRHLVEGKRGEVPFDATAPSKF